MTAPKDDGIVMDTNALMTCFDGVVVHGNIGSATKGYAGKTATIKLEQHNGHSVFIQITGIDNIRKLAKSCCLIASKADTIDRPDRFNSKGGKE